jgi:hypothetical protein
LLLRLFNEAGCRFEALCPGSSQDHFNLSFQPSSHGVLAGRVVGLDDQTDIGRQSHAPEWSDDSIAQRTEVQ